VAAQPSSIYAGVAPSERSAFVADWRAGLTVAVVALPQAVAYSLLAGVPPAHGLATAAVPAFVAGLIGRSPQVATGPTNTTGLLVLAALTPYLGSEGLLSPHGLPVLATLTVLVGVLRVLIGVTGGTWLVRFLPDSVLAAFAAGAGILIASMQIDEALGLPAVRARSLAEQLTGQVNLIHHGAHPSLAALAFAAGTVGVGIWGRRRFPRWPVVLLLVIGASALGWFLGLDGARGLPLVSERAAVSPGWPPVALPLIDIALLRQLFIPACAIILLGTLELTVAARARGAQPDLKREMLAQGCGTILGGFTGCFPASASLTRSALLRMSGARTHAAAALSGLLTVPVVLFSASGVGRIPLSVLAGVLFLVASEMVDRVTLARLWRTSVETRVLLGVTLAATVLLPLEWAVLAGSGLGLVLHLRRTTVPRVRALAPVDGRLLPPGPADAPSAVVLEVSGALHYAAVDAFLKEAERLIPPLARVVVVDLSHAHEIRFTAIRALESLAEGLAQKGVSTWLAGLDEAGRSLLDRSHCKLPFIGAEAEPGRSAALCLERAGLPLPPTASSARR
jgi:SulP family sulfate permease